MISYRIMVFKFDGSRMKNKVRFLKRKAVEIEKYDFLVERILILDEDSYLDDRGKEDMKVMRRRLPRKRKLKGLWR